MTHTFLTHRGRYRATYLFVSTFQHV